MGPIPAKYFWPGFVVALLGVAVGAGVVTIWAAQSDGGAKIIKAKPLPRQPHADAEEAETGGAGESSVKQPSSIDEQE